MNSNRSFDSIPIIGADEEIHSSLREGPAKEPSRTGGWPGSDRPPGSQEKNQRKNARYELARPVICYPILESREVAVSDAMDGVSVNIGINGIKLLVDSQQPFNGMELLIGVERRPGEYRFVSGVAVSMRTAGNSAFEVGIEFRGYLHEVIQCEQIMPVLDTDEMRFHLPYPEPMLASLCKVGAASAISLDAVILCPHCHGIPTFRDGCSLCLSNNVKASKMIHHFACANVDFVENFEQGSELCCQKCRTRRLIVGSDYEYLDGPNMCYDCGQANLEKIQIGHCLGCEHRFPIETAYQMDIIGYRVKRLDILRLIGAS